MSLTVLVTGATGLLGSHVVAQLIDAGYKVRGTARSGTAERLRANHASDGDKFEVAVIDDIATSDFSEAFKGVSALIHVASPLAGAGSTDVVLQGAVNGTQNVLIQAANAGINKVIITSSIAALLGPAQMQGGKKFNETGTHIHVSVQLTVGAHRPRADWSPLTREDALKADATPFEVYATSKKLAEEAVWAFARAHPDIDVTTILPPFLYGPAGRGQVLDAPVSGTNRYVYSLISGPAGRPLPTQSTLPSFAHIADAARAHVLALKAPLSAPDSPKRVIVAGYEVAWRQAVEYLHRAHPELRERLPVLGAEPETGGWATLDSSSAARVLGLTTYKTWEETIEETVTDLLEKEKAFAIKI
ncbi:NAD-P-binding protein [Auriscalpium vulgare]|uniref:NAD-P-binding protein n=1 Tax=Auriscalpium vulgare TaxID=40419 RepID=A0ACB8S2S7_9AGAM|nr:NAD-P-binding protein [Auriscalpium vulgare]